LYRLFYLIPHSIGLHDLSFAKIQLSSHKDLISIVSLSFLQPNLPKSSGAQA